MNQLTPSVNVPDYSGTLPPTCPTQNLKPDPRDEHPIAWNHAKECIAQYIQHFGWRDVRDHVVSLRPISNMSYWDSPNYQINSVESQREELS